MTDFKIGDKVIYIGCSKEQINWGNCDDPKMFLIENTVQYIIKEVEVRSQHTKLTLEHIPAKFNSVCFKKYDY
jgi:hypothetical protein